MSDSDDTDVLLLIPPNFFTVCNEEKLKQLTKNSVIAEEILPDLPRRVPTVITRISNKIHGTNAAGMDKVLTDPVDYDFLSSFRNQELREINVCLQTLSKEDKPVFAGLSDISTISNSTQIGENQHIGLVHSTPKYMQYNGVKNKCQDMDVLAEMDDFFCDHNYINKLNTHNDCKIKRNEFENSNQNMPQHFTGKVTKLVPQDSQISDANLISLSEIWGESGKETAIAHTTLQKSSVREEQLRRQHLEHIVQTLQSQLLEYQQRLSVAIEVDRAKDVAIINLQSNCKSLNIEVKQLRNSVTKLEADQIEHNTKIVEIQNELQCAVERAKNLHEDNCKLESRISLSARKATEEINIYKCQIEDLKIKLKDCRGSEEHAINELNKLKDKLARLENNNEKLKMQCKELEQEREILSKRKEVLLELQQKQKLRFEALEKQTKSLQESSKKLSETEVMLKKKLELQQKTLKSFYQEQLEKAVEQKMNEFRGQLEKMEEVLKSASRERENLLADRAVKQIELINEKSELELNLLQEKHNEEIELYRIQLASASKKIDELETKLNVYKTKRSIIAEKLHGVMETQWQKALEILTSPNNTSQMNNDTETEENTCYENALRTENNRYETPKSSKCTNQRKVNDNNFINNKCCDTLVEPMDRLQAFIELLLSKSPGDFDKLDDILAKDVRSRSLANSNLNRSIKRSHNCKPPWRA